MVETGGGQTKPLPPRLSDPLVSLRNLILGLIIIAVLSIAFTRFIPQSMYRPLIDWVIMGLTTSIALAALLWPILLVLPFRRTNALYLRAFANEVSTSKLRLVLQKELGRGFRLSGIRDPKRRSPLFLRSLTVFIFCFRYSTVRHMNLEAGQDWLPRLWRSLGDARCAFIDVSDVTSNVRSEMQVAYQRMGVSRIMFVGRAGTTDEAARAYVRGALGIDTPDVHSLHIGIWEPTSGAARDTFLNAVRRFVAQLPSACASTVDDEEDALLHQPAWTAESRIRRTWLALIEIAGLAFIPVCLTLYQFGFWSTVNFGGSSEPNPSASYRLYVDILVTVFHWLVVAMFVYLCYAVLQYLLLCGSKAGRVKSAAILVYYSVLILLAVTSD